MFDIVWSCCASPMNPGDKGNCGGAPALSALRVGLLTLKSLDLATCCHHSWAAHWHSKVSVPGPRVTSKPSKYRVWCWWTWTAESKKIRMMIRPWTHEAFITNTYFLQVFSGNIQPEISPRIVSHHPVSLRHPEKNKQQTSKHPTQKENLTNIQNIYIILHNDCFSLPPSLCGSLFLEVLPKKNFTGHLWSAGTQSTCGAIFFFQSKS